jgi:hypothetical protein
MVGFHLTSHINVSAVRSRLRISRGLLAQRRSQDRALRILLYSRFQLCNTLPNFLALSKGYFMDLGEDYGDATSLSKETRHHLIHTLLIYRTAQNFLSVELQNEQETYRLIAY